MSMPILITCKPDYEKILTRELVLQNVHLQTKSCGWILTQGEEQSPSKQTETPLTNLCFAYNILENPVSISATSVNSLTAKLLKIFLTHLGQTRVDEPWAFSFSSSDNEQLIQRTKSVKRCWIDKLRKKMSHVAKLSKEGIPHSSEFVEGFFVHFIDFNQAFVSFKARSAGQQRMQMDPRAPSRSYLKIEEAFKILRHEPQKGETVIDLGAAPGGWSYSALKRGATVTAIDNGPLKGSIKSHQNICHLKADALKYTYDPTKPADWLLCDVLEKPDIILDLLHKWLDKKWCRHFIVNLKVGRNDPILLLEKIRDPQKGILPYCKTLYVKQLYHDREEITLMGQMKE